jgi:hypothetical protein
MIAVVALCLYIVIAGLVPRLSGSFSVDKAHGVDSSVLKRLATF